MPQMKIRPTLTICVDGKECDQNCIYLEQAPDGANWVCFLWHTVLKIGGPFFKGSPLSIFRCDDCMNEEEVGP
jgi:hypothetical protein